MRYSQNDSHDLYHDDPIEERSGRKFKAKFLTTAVIIFGTLFFFQSTFASNISLNSGSGKEFGQGISQSVACSGNTELTLTPRSTFINGSGSSGSHFLKAVTVSNIPVSCYGVDFTITAYDDTASSPLALFNSSTTSAIVFDNSGTFSRGTGSTGMTVVSGAGTFTVTFTAPTALASSVFKVTIQSGANTPYFEVGGAGPGGGTIFYVATTPFACGPTRVKTCTYLEVAPSEWNTGSDPMLTWAQSSPVNYQTTAVNNASSPETASATEIGWGYRNTRAIILQGNRISAMSAAASADSYTATISGVDYDDWYLPSKDELNQMCKWQRGVSWISDATVCTGGTINTGLGAAGFGAGRYWSSSEFSGFTAAFQNFDTGGQGYVGKAIAIFVRPIRAF